MERFFIDPPPSGSKTEIKGPEAHHLLKVKRIQIGEMVVLFDKNGIEYKAQIISCRSKSAQLKIVSQKVLPSQFSVELHLAQGILKSKSWELLLQKTMELGLTQLIPTTSEYTVVNKKAIKPERWQKIILAAAKQCGRNNLLNISDVLSFKEVIALAPRYPICLIAHNKGTFPSLKKTLDQFAHKEKKMLVLIGAEGGFSEEEIKEATEAEFIPVSLGPYTLRAETAAMMATSCIQFYYS